MVVNGLLDLGLAEAARVAVGGLMLPLFSEGMRAWLVVRTWWTVDGGALQHNEKDVRSLMSDKGRRMLCEPGYRNEG